MSNTIYLYLKTHNITGLKYLGKTVSNPFTYPGSGTRWTNHLRVHGNDVSTTILQECQSKEELRNWGIYYSELWNVVNDDTFANLKIEEGDGGDTSMTPGFIEAMKVRNQIPWNIGMKDQYSQTDESNKKRSKTMKEHWSIHEHNRKGKAPWNKGLKNCRS